MHSAKNQQKINVLAAYHHPAGLPSKTQMYAVDRQVIHALRKAGFAVKGVWVSGTGRELPRYLTKHATDVIFNLADGFDDNTMTAKVADVIARQGVPYTGNTGKIFRQATNKAITKKRLAAIGLSVPSGQVFKSIHTPRRRNLKFPLILKPCCDDASIGISDNSVVQNTAALTAKLSQLFSQSNQAILAEEYLDGPELSVPLLNGNPLFGAVQVFYDDKYYSKRPRIQTYAAKNSPRSLAYKNSPVGRPTISAKTLKIILRMASQAYRALGLQGYASVDFRLSNTTPCILEVNPNPNIGPRGDLQHAARLAGVSYSKLLWLVVNQALKDHATFRSLRD